MTRLPAELLTPAEARAIIADGHVPPPDRASRPARLLRQLRAAA